MTKELAVDMTTEEYQAHVWRTMREAEFTAQVIAEAKAQGWLVAHFRPARTAKGWRTAMSGDPGFPDLVLARRGRVIAAELKRYGQKARPEQNAWLDALGGTSRVETWVWWPTDWERIKAVLA